jgi:hypothetical protein
VYLTVCLRALGLVGRVDEQDGSFEFCQLTSYFEDVEPVFISKIFGFTNLATAPKPLHRRDLFSSWEIEGALDEN